jgi:hypothetical protein
MKKHGINPIVAVFVILLFSLMACLVLFVPAFKSPTMLSEVTLDVGMGIVVVFLAIVTYKNEAGTSDHVFWLNILIGASFYLLLRIVKFYILRLVFHVDPGLIQYLNLGYLVSFVFVISGLAHAIRNYKMKLKAVHFLIIISSCLLVLGFIAYYLISGMIQAHDTRFTTVLASLLEILFGAVIIILCVSVIIKTMGGIVQRVFVYMSLSFLATISVQVSYTLDKLRGLPFSQGSAATIIFYFLFCIFSVFGCLHGLDVRKREDDLYRHMLD